MNKKIISIIMVMTMIMTVALPILSYAATQTQLTVKAGNKVLSSSSVNEVNAGDKIVISANTDVKYIKYKVGEGEIVTKNANSAEIAVPSNFSSFSLNVYARVNDTQTIGWMCYDIKVASDTSTTQPQITVKSGDTVFANNGIYSLNAGDKIQINVSGNVDYIKYKVGTGELITVNSSSVTLTVPDNFVRYSIQVFARTKEGIATGDEYNYYTVNVNQTTVAPKLEVKSGNTIFADNGTYTLKVGDKIKINAIGDVDYIKYKVGEGEAVTVNSSSVELEVPCEFSKYSLQVYARGGANVDGWYYYNIVVEKDSIAPTITTKSGNTTFKNNGTYELEVGDKITITAVPDVEYIKYKVGTGDVVTVNASKVTLTVPDDLAKFSLQVLARGKGGVAGWDLYNIVVNDVNNYDYPFNIEDDEKENKDVEGVAISLRTIPLTKKDGNQNFFELDEKIQYNIDFVNGGKTIDGKVNIYFTIPSNVKAKFVDLNGGTLVDDYTVRWTFDGLARGEKGTIPVVLKYIEMDGDSQIVKPYAKIVASSNEDMSAVINFIFADESTKVNTDHKPFMVGDARTYTFRPYEGLNRAEMAIILTRIFNIPLVENYVVTYDDADVIAQGKYAWAEQAIMTVTKYGLMEGYDDGDFKPGAKVTYAQLITVLARQLEIENNVNGLNPFEIKDEPIKLYKDSNKVYSDYGYTNHWANKYLAQMLRLNMLPDFDNTYNGDVDDIIERANVAKLISLVLLRGPAEDGTYNDSLTNDFVDVTTRTKNYEYILEATADRHNSKFTDDGIEIMYK